MSEQQPKNRLSAVLLSALVCPGAGQLYYRRHIRGTLLVTASIALIGLLIMDVWTEMFRVTMSMPPDRVIADAFGIAHRIVQNRAESLSRIVYGLAALWVYGIADALVPPRSARARDYK